MCGIVGYCDFFVNKQESVHILSSMLNRIRHRGPDESGVYVSGDFGFGSVRLSIIDLDTGTMPISNVDKSLWIVYNGEVFNYLELREDLIEKGYSFKTDSDTEVILLMYQEYGPACLKKLNGQFSIAIWNEKERELFLARDRVGIRPLFYTELNGSFIFASEIKALLEFPGINLKISSKVLKEYFTFWTPISSSTIFEGVYEVPPGSYLQIKKTSKRIFKYWEVPNYKPSDLISDLKQATREFENLFRDSIRLRLRSDVPVGAYLSGGIDSSCTTSFIQEVCPDLLQTFSIAFKEKEFDESEYQRLAVDYFNTNHTNFTCDSKEIANNFESTVWHSECPLLRTSPVPMTILAERVYNHNIKVVITGEGADELLGGYNIFKETKIRKFWARDPNSKLRPLLLKKLYPYLNQFDGSSNNMLKMFYGYRLQDTDSPIYSHLIRWNNTSRINRYLSNTVTEQVRNYNPIEEYESKFGEKLNEMNWLSRAQFIELNLFMSRYLLSSQGDRMSMAHSVEGRYPFLDHRIIEFCMRLSPDLKINGLNEKYLLKKMVKGRVPDEILSRSKQAYRAPIKSVFISDDAPEYLKRMISQKAIEDFGIFNPGHVNQLLTKMKNENRISEVDNMALTGILSVQILKDQFVNKSMPKLEDNDCIHLNKIVLN